MKPVTDPDILAQLNAGPKPVTDPSLLAQLNGGYHPDPTAGMSGPEKFLAGTGKAFVDLSRGARQLLPGDNTQLNQEVAESRHFDAPLMKTGAGIAGNLTGNIAALTPTAFIPGANTYAGAALIGAGAGALVPTMSDESKVANAGMGAASGIAGQGLGRALGRALRPVQPSLNTEQSALAQAAQQQGIPLRASQVTGSKPLALTESVMENLPFTSGSQIAQKSGQKSAYNAAVLGKAGITADKATPEVLNAQKQALGSTFEDIASRNSIDFNQGVTSKLADISNQASRRLAKPEPITNTIDDILSDVDKNGLLEGTKYQGWRSELGRMARGNDTEAHYASQVKQALDEAFNSQISGADSEAWKTASRQYGNLKNILQAMGGAGTDQLSGNIPPSQLAQALTRQVGKEGKALGRGDLNELTKVGRAFISENLPDSGTAQRSFYQNLLTGNLASAGLGAGGGAGIGYVYGGPQGALEGAGIGAAATLGGPKLAQMLMNSKAGQAYLTKGIVPISQIQRDILAQALRLGGTGAASQMLQNQ